MSSLVLVLIAFACLEGASAGQEAIDGDLPDKGSTKSTSTRPIFLGLGHLPASFDIMSSGAIGVSADGFTVVGVSAKSGGLEAFIWHDGVMAGLGDLNGGLFSSAAEAVSADGKRIVGSGRPANGREAVLWDNGNLIGLGDVQGGIPESSAAGISWAGDVIVGSGTLGLESVGFKWSGERLEALPKPFTDCLYYSASAISGDGRIVAGTCRLGNRTIGVAWDGLVPSMLPLPEGYLDVIHVNAASKDGSTIVGTVRNPTLPVFEAVRWVDGTCHVLLPGAHSYAWATSGDGSIIVGHVVEDSRNSAFVWYADRGVIELESLLVDDLQLNLGGFSLTVARGVSADGSVIVGSGINPRGRGEAWLAVVPTDIEGDADLDGVPDYRDACDYTIPGANVDPAGCPPPSFGDTDRDGDFDLQDFSRLLPCMHGANAPVPISCRG